MPKHPSILPDTAVNAEKSPAAKPHAAPTVTLQADEASATGAEEGSKPSYHHGSLREALLAEAARVIETDGVEQVSIRQLAKNLGVSPGAPFRHFADRRALFTAVAEQATERLAQALGAALEASADASAWMQMAALGRAYLAWARAHRSHFLIVSDRSLIDYAQSPAMQASNAQIRQRMRSLLAQSASERAGPAGPATAATGVDPELMVLMLRAMVYGLARMEADGQWAEWSPSPAPAAEVQNQALEAFLQVLGAYDAQP